MTASQLAPGQRWKFKSRSKEPSATLVVLRIDGTPSNAQVVSVRFEDVLIDRGPTLEPQTTLPHSPIALELVLPSLVGLCESNCDVGDLKGYKLWKDAFDRRNAGYFTVSPAEVLDLIEEAYSKSGAAHGPT